MYGIIGIIHVVFMVLSHLAHFTFLKIEEIESSKYKDQLYLSVKKIDLIVFFEKSSSINEASKLTTCTMVHINYWSVMVVGDHFKILNIYLLLQFYAHNEL